MVVVCHEVQKPSKIPQTIVRYQVRSNGHNLSDSGRDSHIQNNLHKEHKINPSTSMGGGVSQIPAIVSPLAKQVGSQYAYSAEAHPTDNGREVV